MPVGVIADVSNNEDATFDVNELFIDTFFKYDGNSEYKLPLENLASLPIDKTVPQHNTWN